MTGAPGAEARAIIERLNLEPHPEGGWYRETFRDPAGADGRSHATAIYYLLAAGERSWWHRVDSAEIWHYYAGAALELLQSEDGETATRALLGPDLAKGQAPQLVVPSQTWQSAFTTGDWTLVGCTVAPGFEFSGFELAPADFSPRG